MSIIPQGTQGYLDWQRTVALDGPTFYNQPASIPPAGNVNLGPFDVTRFAYLACQFSGGIADAQQYAFTWTLDQAGTQIVGSWVWTYEAHAAMPLLHIPNRGPFVKVSIADQGATGFASFVTLFGTNRPQGFSGDLPLASNPILNYSDAGATNSLGVQYVVPTVPNVAAGDHPPNEVSLTALTFNSTTNAQILAAPGAGKRYRVFGISLFATSNWCYVNDNTGVAITGVSSGGTANWLAPGQGVPLATNSALAVGGAGAGGTTGIVTVQYTTETI